MRRRSLVVVALSVVLLSAGGVVVAGDQSDNAELEADEVSESDLSAQQLQQQAPQQDRPLLRGSPRLELHAPNPTVQSGETNEVPIQVSNDGSLSLGTSEAREVVTTARNVRLEPDDDSTDLSVRSGEMAVGAVTETQPAQTSIVVDVPDDIDSGTHSINVDVAYSYTYQQSGGGVTYDRSSTRTKSIDVVVDDDAQFEIVGATTDASIGDSGTLEAVVENTGDETARDVSVALESRSGGFVFGESPQDTARVGELEAGETTTVTYDVTVLPDTSQRQYTLDGTVQFRTGDGLQRVDQSPSVGVIPQAEQQFALSDIDSTLYVGEEGDLHGTVTNVGPNTAQNVVVRYTDDSPNVVPIETAVAVGTLEAGESTTFRLPLEVSGEAEPVDRAIDLAVQYRNNDFQQRLYEDLEIVADVSPKRDQFLVDVQDRQIAAGGEKHVDVDVTNNLDQTVTDVEARLFASDPLDSDDDEGFIEELEPGESTTMTFALEADGSATAKTYPISFDFRYDDERGTSQLSGTTRVAIEVTESEGGLPLLLIGTILLTGLGAGAYVYQRS